MVQIQNASVDVEYYSRSSGEHEQSGVNEYGVPASTSWNRMPPERDYPASYSTPTSSPDGMCGDDCRTYSTTTSQCSNDHLSGVDADESKSNTASLTTAQMSAADLHRDVSQYCYWKTQDVIWQDYSMSGANRKSISSDRSAAEQSTPARTRQTTCGVPAGTELGLLGMPSSGGRTSMPSSGRSSAPQHICATAMSSCLSFDLDECAKMLCRTVINQALVDIYEEDIGRIENIIDSRSTTI